MAEAGILVDVNGRALALGTELGRGGEGVVYEVNGQPDLAVKLYAKPLSSDQVAKLRAMVASKNDRLLKLTAWPIEVAALSKRSAGFVMPKVSGFRPAFELYGPKLRLQQFPKADWRFLIRTAANTARAFSVVHVGGHVIGDVNHGNLLVGRDATVRLIDCDSFQITQGQKTWFCEVGVGTHQPPEMQARSFGGVVRTPNQDLFGLAVLIFQMLCLGRHPYSGRFLGAGEQPSIEDAIRQYRYAYGGEARLSLMTPPPASLPMDALTPQIRQLFEKAFLRGSEQGTRPSAAQWIDALTDLERKLKQCSFGPSHYYLGSLSSCPWCEIEAKSGTALFPVVFVSGAGGADGFMFLWQQVETAQPPGPRPPMPDLPQATPSAGAKAAGRQLRLTWIITGVILMIGWAILLSPFGNLPFQGDAMIAWPLVLCLILLLVTSISGRDFRRKWKPSHAEWKVLRKEWMASNARDPASIRTGLESLKRNYDALQADRAARLRKLHEDRRLHQLREYLDRFQIAGAKIKGVGPAKATTLQSYSIETAADVVFASIVAVPGFGPKTAQSLVDWRANLERSFRFDPRRGVPQADIDTVENSVTLQRRQLEQRLSAGLTDLRLAIKHETDIRAQLHAKFSSVAPIYAQVLADCRATSVLGVR